MTAKEFNQKDTELLAQISEYRDSSNDHQIQIAMNEREITRLEQQRVELRNQYVNEEESL